MVSKSSKRAVSASDCAAGAGSLPERRFKGVRMRSWGKWVSEIRLPNTRARLWLGSFATAHQAARAFDVAVVCLRGPSATLNFPDSPPTHAPLGLPLHRIQELAAAAAATDAAPSSPQVPPNGIPSPSAASSFSGSPSEPASPFSTLSEPVSFVQPEFAVSTQSDPQPAACSSPSYSCCDELEAATPPDTCSSTWQIPEDLQTLPWDCNAVQEQLCLGVQWEELLWGSGLSSSAAWEQQLLTFPLLPPQDNMIEDRLWAL